MRRLLTAAGFGSVILVAYLAGKTDAPVIREPASCPIPMQWIPVVTQSQPEDNKGEAPPAIIPKKKPPKPKAQPAVWTPDRGALFGGK